MDHLNRRAVATSLLTLTFALMLLGCGGGLQVRRVNSAEAKPNNVWVFFSVKDGKNGVGGLQAKDFTIYEDDKEVSLFESQQVIQNPEVAAVMYTLLLVDMSGSITESGHADKLVDAAKRFAERVGKSQKVGVYAFDGSPKLHSVTPFTESKGSVEGGLEGLRNWKPKDPSTNLRGAVVEGLQTLKKELDREKKPLKFGTLVVFSDGTDQASRVSEKDMMKELNDDKYEFYEVYAVGVGAEMAESELKDIGRDGMELADDHGKIDDAFDKIAERIENATRAFYLLSYCTPARAGQHEVRIVAHDRKEDGEKSGGLEYTFDAEGFGPPPKCDPNKKPQFDLKQPDVDAEDGGSAGVSVKAGASVKK